MLVASRRDYMGWSKPACTKKLKEMGFTAAKGESCLYYIIKGDAICLILIYMDDIFLAPQEPKWIKDIKRDLAIAFDLRDFGFAQYCLRFEISRNDNMITLSQQRYIQELLSRFGMEECKHVAIPAENNQTRSTWRRCLWELRNMVILRARGCTDVPSHGNAPWYCKHDNQIRSVTNDPGRQHWIAAASWDISEERLI